MTGRELLKKKEEEIIMKRCNDRDKKVYFCFVKLLFVTNDVVELLDSEDEEEEQRG